MRFNDDLFIWKHELAGKHIHMIFGVDEDNLHFTSEIFTKTPGKKSIASDCFFFGLLHGLSSSPYNSSVSVEFFFYSQSVFTSLAWSLARCRLASTPYFERPAVNAFYAELFIYSQFSSKLEIC